jgi:hypothetical protein
MPGVLAASGCTAVLPIASSVRAHVIRQPATLSSFRPLATKPQQVLGGRSRHPTTSLLLGSKPTFRATSRKSTTLVRSQKGDEKSFIDAARDAASGKPGLESDKLDSKVRRRAEDAILTRGNRVTVGDVASTSGLTIFEAESALKALAADSLATLAVSNQGEILYCFPSDFRSAIRNRSLKTRLESFATATSEISGYLIRVLYGTALIASIATVTTALIVIASSSKDDRGRGRSGGGGGGISFNYSGTRAMFDLTDYLFFYDPYYYRRRRMALFRGEQRNSWNFVEAVFSFVFGDGDPNVAYEEKKWEIVGKFIASKGGVVTAEQLAPFMDVNLDQVRGKNNQNRSSTGVVVDESYVLPALTRFKGTPEVDAEGHIVYVFPALQTTADARKQREWFNFQKTKKDSFTAPAPAAPVKEVLESPWKLTGVTGGQLGSVVALGVANLVGVLWLSTALATPANAYALAMNGLGWIFGTMPYLQIYAVSFFMIPAVRWLLYQGRNQAINNRNEAKIAALRQLENPSQEVVRKMAAAAVLAQQNLVTKEDAVFRSDKEVEQQPIDVEADVWERKLERRASERDLKNRGWMPAPKRSVEKKIQEERW